MRSVTDGRFYALKVLRKTDLLRLKQVRAPQSSPSTARRPRPMTVPARRRTPALGSAPACTPHGPHRPRARFAPATQSHCFWYRTSHQSTVLQVQHVLDERKLLLEVRHPFIVTL